MKRSHLNVTFVTDYNLKKMEHKYSVHEKKKPFKYRICDKGFTINHFKAKHEDSYCIGS